MSFLFDNINLFINYIDSHSPLKYCVVYNKEFAITLMILLYQLEASIYQFPMYLPHQQLRISNNVFAFINNIST